MCKFFGRRKNTALDFFQGKREREGLCGRLRKREEKFTPSNTRALTLEKCKRFDKFVYFFENNIRKFNKYEETKCSIKQNGLLEIVSERKVKLRNGFGPVLFNFSIVFGVPEKVVSE